MRSICALLIREPLVILISPGRLEAFRVVGDLGLLTRDLALKLCDLLVQAHGVVAVTRRLGVLGSACRVCCRSQCGGVRRVRALQVRHL